MTAEWTDWILTPAPEVDDETLAAVQAELGVRLPDDYLAVVRHNQGRTPEPSVVPLPDGTETILDHLLIFESSPKANNIVAKKKVLEYLPQPLVPFASDPGGSLLCFDFGADASAPPVVFWSLEDPQAPPARVADSFAELIEALQD